MLSFDLYTLISICGGSIVPRAHQLRINARGCLVIGASFNPTQIRVKSPCLSNLAVILVIDGYEAQGNRA